MQNDPQGKTVLVTGANRGIGLSIAKALLDAGAAKLYAAVRNPASAQPLERVREVLISPIHGYDKDVLPFGPDR